MMSAITDTEGHPIMHLSDWRPKTVSEGPPTSHWSRFSRLNMHHRTIRSGSSLLNGWALILAPLQARDSVTGPWNC